MTGNVEIIEVSPRDGIQNGKKLLTLETKLGLILYLPLALKSFTQMVWKQRLK